jgi:hypothetical protein
MEIANDITAPATRPDPSGCQRRLSLGSQEMGRATPLKIINPYVYACSFADGLCEIGQIFPGREFWFYSKGPRKQRRQINLAALISSNGKKSKPRKSEPVILAHC